MFSWQYNEKILTEFIYNHAQDFGRLYCQIMLDSPKIFREFMKGFHDELDNRVRQGQRVGGDDTPPSDENGVSGG